MVKKKRYSDIMHKNMMSRSKTILGECEVERGGGLMNILVWLGIPGHSFGNFIMLLKGPPPL